MYFVLENARLVVIDTRTDKLVRMVNLNVGTNTEQSIAIDPNTHRLYVTIYQKDIAVFNLRTYKRIGTLPDNGDSVTVDPVTNQIWGTDYQAATVEVFNGDSDRLIHTIQIGARARPINCSSNCKIIPAGTDGVVVDDATDMAYADDTNSGQFFVIDGKTFKWVTFFLSRPRATSGRLWTRRRTPSTRSTTT